MTSTEIKVELMCLGKKQKDLIPELAKRGIIAAPCEISQAFNASITYSPVKWQRIRSATEEIITEWKGAVHEV